MKRLALVLCTLFVMAPAMADPPALRLFYDAANHYVRLYWSTPTQPSAYQIRRTSSYPNWDHTFQVPGYITSTGEPVSTGTAYVYQVVPLDANSNPLGSPSNAALVYTAPSFTDDPLAGGTTAVKPAHVTELRPMLNALRAAAGVGAYTWTTPGLTSGSAITAPDVSNLRSAFDGAIANLGLTSPGWDDPSLSGVQVKKLHIQQLRNRIRSFPYYMSAYTNTQSVSNPYFSPNGDGVKDTTTYQVLMFNATSESRFRLDVRRNATNAVVRSAIVAGSGPTFTWDGRDGGGVVQPDGAYTFELVDVDGLPSPLTTAAVTLDVTPPVAAIASPAAGSMVSNVRLNGSGSVPVTGTATDTLGVASWQLDRIGNNQAQASIGSGTSAVQAGGTLATWGTSAIPNGAYTLRLTVTDWAGTSTTATADVTVSHFSASLATHELNPTTAQTVAYTSVVPYTVTETITIRNATTNTDVRTLFQGTRTAQTYVDPWDGKDAAGQMLADGPYRYYATVTDGAYSMTWDQSNDPVPGGYTQYPYPTCRNAAGSQVACNDASLVFDPYRNKPLRINYCVSAGDVATGCSGSGPVTIVAKISSANEENSSCTGSNCIGTWYESSGPHEIVWYGTNQTGQFIAGSGGVRLLVLRGTTYPKNLLLLFGTTPSLSNLAISPMVFNPAAGSATFTMDVGSPLGRPITLSAKFLNMASGTVLRTVTNAPSSAGTQSIAWDGKADNGMWVAPGQYEVRISATDSIGSQVTIKPLVTVRY